MFLQPGYKRHFARNREEELEAVVAVKQWRLRRFVSVEIVDISAVIDLPVNFKSASIVSTYRACIYPDPAQFR